MPIVIVGVFITVLTIVFGAYLLLVVRPEQQESGAVRRRLKGNQPRIVKAELGKAEEALSTVFAAEAWSTRLTRTPRPVISAMSSVGPSTPR